jgi:hypothetical protein
MNDVRALRSALGSLGSLAPLACLALATVATLGACGGPLAEGRSEFNAGHYPRAKQIFASIEAESRGYAEGDRAEYDLYRGLTLLSLGDRAQAGTWLREAKAIEDTRPGTLPPEDAQRLKASLESGD